MNRDELVEKAADVLHGGVSRMDIRACPMRSCRDEHRARAEDVLDALLPQVSTVEELAELPWNAVVATADGHTYRAESPLMAYVLQRGPVTVVWSPS